MSRLRGIATMAALGLAGCTAADTTAPPSPAPTVTVTETTTASPATSATPDATTSPEDAPTAEPAGLQAPTVASLDVVEPSVLGVALVAVDESTGTVSWWDGFDWTSFDVDAALGPRAWATDGEGGLLFQDEPGNVFHLPPFSDEPELLLDAPPEDDDPTSAVVSRLVGGGIVNGRAHALMEQGLVTNIEDSSSDLVAYDVEGRQDQVLLENVTGWESGLDEAVLIEQHVVLDFFSNAQTFAFVDALDGSSSFTMYSGEEQDLVVGGGPGPGGEPTAVVVAPSSSPGGYPWVCLTRDFGRFQQATATALPLHDADWRRVSLAQGRVLVSADGAAVVQQDTGAWASLELTVPGIVVVADGLAIG